MRERDLYRPLIEGANAEGWLLYRIEDGGYGRKPCDVGGMTPRGRSVILEAKVMSSRSAFFPWSQFEPHQLTWLQACADRGGLALAAVYYESSRELVVFKLRKVLEVPPDKSIVTLLRTRQPDAWRGWSGLLDVEGG